VLEESQAHRLGLAVSPHSDHRERADARVGATVRSMGSASSTAHQRDLARLSRDDLGHSANDSRPGLTVERESTRSSWRSRRGRLPHRRDDASCPSGHADSAPLASVVSRNTSVDLLSLDLRWTRRRGKLDLVGYDVQAKGGDAAQEMRAC